jgi:hypothetical protein
MKNIDKLEFKSHNAIPGTPGIVKVKKFGNSATLRKNIVGEFEISLSSYSKEDQERIKTLILKTKMSGYAAHHIIPVEMRKHPAIVKIGMDMNHYQNGIFLPHRDSNMHALSTHTGFHKIYNEVVKEYLDNISERLGKDANVEAYSNEVAQLQIALRKCLRNGLPMYAKKQKIRGVKAEDRGGGATKELWKKNIDRELSKLSAEPILLNQNKLEPQKIEAKKYISRAEREKDLIEAFSVIDRSYERTNEVMSKKYDESYKKYYSIAKGQIKSTFESYPDLDGEKLASKMMRNYGITDLSREKLIAEVFSSMKTNVADLAEAYCHAYATEQFKNNVLAKEMSISYGTKHIPAELAEYMNQRSKHCEVQIEARTKSAEKSADEYNKSKIKNSKTKSTAEKKIKAEINAKNLYEIQKRIWLESESAALTREQVERKEESQDQSQGQGQGR